MFNIFKKQDSSTREITYHVLISREGKVVCWKTRGRGWDIYSNAPTALVAALANDIEIKHLRPHPNNDGTTIGTVTVRAVISRQAQWKRGRKKVRAAR